MASLNSSDSQLRALERLRVVGKHVIVHAGKVLSSDGVELHPMWLRERCLSPKSVQLETRQALGQPHELPEDLGIASAALISDSAGAETLKVIFSDGHESSFLTELLDKEVGDFSAHGIQQRDVAMPEASLWNRDTGADVLYVPYRGIAAGDVDAILAFTERLFRHGHAVVTGVPCQDKQLLEFIKALTHFECRDAARPTNWGDVFNVQSKPDVQSGNAKMDLAYTSVALSPHVDNPYRDPNPGFQALHALENECTSGLSLAVDGFYVAEKLRAENPEYFKLLSSVDCRWENDGGDRSSALVAFAPWISVCHRTGRVKQIRYAPKSGGFVPALRCPETMKKLYAARRRFADMLNDAANQVLFKLNKGEIWVFNNLRVLHGRTAFNPNEGCRHMQGAYFDMDGLQTAYFRAKYTSLGRA